MKKPKISVVIPVYNEERSVLNTAKQLKKTISKIKTPIELIFVNDGSRDRSGQILSKVKGIKVINKKQNQGYGASLKTGIKAAKGAYILITDADGTYPIKDIPRLIRLSKDYDMVIGARIGKTVQIPLLRRPAKYLLTKFASYLAGYRIPDLNSGLRIFKKTIAEKYWSLFPQKFSFTSTITMICHTNNYDVKYIPINYFKRKGKSTISPIKDFVRFNSLLLRLAINFNPLKVFIPISLLIFILGLAWSLYVIIGSYQMPELGVTLILASLQMFFIGVLAEGISKKN